MALRGAVPWGACRGGRGTSRQSPRVVPTKNQIRTECPQHGWGGLGSSLVELEAKRPSELASSVLSRGHLTPPNSSVPDQIGPPLPIRQTNFPASVIPRPGFFVSGGSSNHRIRWTTSAPLMLRNQNRCRSILGLAQMSESKGRTRLLVGTVALHLQLTSYLEQILTSRHCLLSPA